ncbi:hypothetical protein M3Y99_01880500 [Aphelenchoides fujianensis]|nr:hypothetical protein M3Y99_01880500 [Aphelenchoides fujianensis]
MSKHVDKRRMRAIRAGALCEDLATNCRQVEEYKDDCIEQTCTSDEEKGDKQSKECKEWCEKDDTNKAKCAAPPPPKPDEKNCKDEKQKYEKDCIAETCGSKEELEKPSDKCKEFCSADPKPPSCDADCAPASDKRYEEKCWPATCIRPEEQGDKQNPACKTWCEKDENKDKCKKDDPKPPAPALDCSKPETKFTEECLPTTCPNAKDEAACKLYCGRAKKDDKACTGITAITCDAAKTDAECLPHFCRIGANKDKPACIPHCKTKPEEKGECVGVSPESDADPPGKNCEGKLNDDRFEQDNCWQYSCKKQTLKGEQKCIEHCNGSPGQEDFACAAVAPGAADAGCTADEFANDACTKHACRVRTNKDKDQCKDYCEANKKDKVCIGVEPKANAKCDAEDKKYSQECISYTCRKTAEKDKPECENLCLYKPDDDACAL